MKLSPAFKLATAAILVLALANCKSKTEKKTDNKTENTTTTANAAQPVVAHVNGNPISQRQLDRVVKALANNKMGGHKEAGKKEDPQEQDKTKKEALVKLIELELLYQESQDKKIEAKKEDVDKLLTKIKSQFPDEATFKKTFDEMLSTEAEVREDIRKNLCVEQFIKQEIAPKIQITEEEGNKFYKDRAADFNRPESVHVSHVLVKLDNKAPKADEDAARKKIEDVKKRIKKGEKFADVAKSSSDCPSAKDGGDLGFVLRGQTVAEFEKAAFALDKPGQMSDIIRTSFGFHIIKLEEKRPAGPIPFAEVKSNIMNYLQNLKIGAILQAHVKDLYSKAKIDSTLDISKVPVAN